MTPKILVFSGSIRAGSLNDRLAAIAAARLEALGAEVRHISLADYPMPFVGTDSDLPETARQLRALVDAHHGLFITSPEYNSGYTPLLKNALDWISMVPGAPPSSLKGKMAAIGAASPGVFGGLRAATQLRSVMEMGYGAHVVPAMALVGQADKVLGEDGAITDARANAMLDATLEGLLKLCRAMNA